MADFTRQTGAQPKINISPGPVDKEIYPISGWTKDFPGCHCFLVNLPGYKEDNIKLKVDKSGIVVVSGRRKVDDEKHEHFEKSFNVPEDGDVNNIKKIFDGATLRVRIPKVPRKESIKPGDTDGASTYKFNTKVIQTKEAGKRGKESDNSVLSGHAQGKKGKELAPFLRFCHFGGVGNENFNT